MARRRRKRISKGNGGDDRPAQGRAGGGAHADRDASSKSGADPRVVIGILAGFAALSALVFASSWPGYVMSIRTRSAEAAIDERRYADAIEPLELIVEKTPSAWRRQVQLGDCYLETGEPAEALVAYATALEFNPRLEIRAKIGIAYFNDDPNSRQAIDNLLAARQADPRDAETNYYIGLYQMHHERYREAANAFRAASADPELLEKAKPYLEQIKVALLGSSQPPPG